MAQKNIIVTFNHPAAISNTIRWARIDGVVTPIYTTVFGVTISPYVIQNVPNGQYRIFVTPVYADGRICTPTMIETPPCTGITSFSATLSEGSFDVEYTANVSVPYVQVNINYPNGGFSSTQHINDGNNIIISPPANVYGTFNFTMQPVCDPDTGWIGSPTAISTVVVTPPNNSLLTNNATGNLEPVSMTSFDGGGQLVFASASVADGGGNVGFYIPDGLYTSLVINYATAVIAAASLVTTSGTYTGVLTANTITFNNVSVSGGVAITVT